MRVVAEGVKRGRRVLRASGKAVCTWPLAIAVDAGLMQIQLEERSGVEVCRGLRHREPLTTACANDLASTKTIAMSVPKEAGTRDLCKGNI